MHLCKDYGIPFQDGVRINNISLQKPSPPSFAALPLGQHAAFRFSVFLFPPWRTKVFLCFILFRRGGKGYLLIYPSSAVAEEHFFSVQPLSAVAEAPRLFGFLVSVGGVLCLRHRAAVADGDGVVIPPR